MTVFLLAERCSCGARFEAGWLVPWWVARRAAQDWRTEHVHAAGDDQLSLGGYGGGAQLDASTDAGQPVLGFRPDGPA